MKSFIVDAFTTDNLNSGNRAGVVLFEKENEILDCEMQKIAYKNGYSETAFFDNFKIRYFTPVSEVPLCGHATVATLKILQNEKVISETYNGQIITKAGKLDVSSQNSKLYLEMAAPEFKIDEYEKKYIADLLSLKEDDLVSGLEFNLPIKNVSTGLFDLLVPIKNKEVMSKINPKFVEIKKFSEANDKASIHVFTLETNHKDIIAQVRNFAPLYDIPEESATGTAAGALSAYFKKYLPNEILLKHKTFNFLQGIEMKKPSMVSAFYSENSKLFVGGEARIIN